MDKSYVSFKEIPKTKRRLLIDFIFDGTLRVPQKPHALFAVARNQSAFDGPLGCACSSGAQRFFQTWCSHADFHDDSPYLCILTGFRLFYALFSVHSKDSLFFLRILLDFFDTRSSLGFSRFAVFIPNKIGMLQHPGKALGRAELGVFEVIACIHLERAF